MKRLLAILLSLVTFSAISQTPPVIVTDGVTTKIVGRIVFPSGAITNTPGGVSVSLVMPTNTAAGGSSGDIQLNNGGVLGGSVMSQQSLYGLTPLMIYQDASAYIEDPFPSALILQTTNFSSLVYSNVIGPAPPQLVVVGEDAYSAFIGGPEGDHYVEHEDIEVDSAGVLVGKWTEWNEKLSRGGAKEFFYGTSNDTVANYGDGNIYRFNRSGALLAGGTDPGFWLKETDAASGSKIFKVLRSGGVTFFTDADDVGVDTLFWLRHTANGLTAIRGPSFDIGNLATGPGSLHVLEDSDNGVNYWSLTSASSLAANYAITLGDTGAAGFPGAVTATSFSGAGSALTALNGSNVSSGTVADARLSSNVALKDSANIFTGLNSAQTFYGRAVQLGTISGAVSVSATNSLYAYTASGDITWTFLDLPAAPIMPVISFISTEDATGGFTNTVSGVDVAPNQNTNALARTVFWYATTNAGSSFFAGSDYSTSSGSGLANIVEDTTPQLGGDLDLNGHNIDFPTTANISDVIDDDSMATASPTKLATSESIKAYIDANSGAATAINDIADATGAGGVLVGGNQQEWDWDGSGNIGLKLYNTRDDDTTDFIGLLLAADDATDANTRFLSMQDNFATSAAIAYDFTGTGATFNRPITLGNSSGLTIGAGGHLTTESVTATGATGTGNLVFSASPTFTGSPVAPTQTASDNSTKIATTAYVDAAVAAGGGGGSVFGTDADWTARYYPSGDNTPVEYGQTWAVSGTWAYQSPTSTREASEQARSSTTILNVAGLSGNGNYAAIGNRPWYFSARFGLASTNGVMAFVGLAHATAAQMTNLVDNAFDSEGFYYDDIAGNTTWQAYVRNGSGNTTSDTGVGVLADSLHHTFTATYNGTTIIYYIDGTSVRTNANTFIPTSTMQFMMTSCNRVGGAGTDSTNYIGSVFVRQSNP